MPFIKNVKLEMATKGGFIVRYDYFDRRDPNSTFSNMEFISTQEEVFADGKGKDALDKLIELSESPANLEAIAAGREEKIAEVTKQV